MFKMAESSRSLEARTLKDRTLELESSHTSSVRNGPLTMSTKPKTERLLASMSHTRSILAEPSSSDQECQCKEFLPLSVAETWLSGPTTDKTTTRSSSWTQEPRPSNLLLKTPSQLISRTAVAHQIFRFGTPTQDGSSSSNTTTVPS
jgi:hypothetical protein